MLTGFAALFLALAAGTAGTLWRNLGATQQRDHQELARLASAVEIQASQLLETADTALANLAASLVKDPHALAAFEELQTHYLRSLPFLLGLSLVDQHGLVKASTNAADSGMQVDLRRLAPTLPQSDRMAIAPRAQGRSLIESHPTAAPGPGFIPLVRRVQLPDSKAMLLVALLDSDALTGYQLQLLDTSPKDTRVQLALEDGSLLTQAGGHTRYQRHSFRAPSLPRDNLPEASQEWYGPLETADGLRLGAMQRATSLPLVSVVERPYPSTLQRSWLALRTPLALMLPALSLIALLSLIAWRNVRAGALAMHDRAAARLQAARYQQELSALKQSAHGLTFRTDSQGTICAVNAHWHTLASQSAKSAIGQRLWDLVLPDCRPAVANLFTTGKPGDLQTTQARLAHPDGTVRVLDISVMPLHDDSGRLHGFAGCASDCTELLATRQQLQDQQAFSSLSFESIPVPICETGLDGRLVSVNHAWERFMGLRREQVLGLRHDEFLPQDQARVYDAQDQSFGTRTCYEAALRQADGKPHTVQVTKVRRLSHLGQPLGMLIVSVQTKAHAMAVQATARSTHGHSEFAARLSQELLRPLQSILGFSELGMAHARSQAALAAMFQEIRAAGESIHQQLHEWLDITEAERCIDTYLFARHDLRRLIGVVAAELQPQLQRKQLTLELQLGTEPLVATVDSQHFTRVMGHVLASAAQFSPQGQSIHVAAHAPDDATIHISIRDQGPGRGQGADISGPEIQAILQAVAPGDCTIATSASENLGLSTCQKIVTAHGGRIYTTNTPQGGAAVHIHLPIDAGR